MEFAIAIDVGGTSIKYALVSRDGDIVYESSNPVRSEGNTILFSEELKGIVRELIGQADLKGRRIAGIGVGVPSVVDNDGTVLFANNLPAINNQRPAVILSEFDLPVFVDNDANLMGLGEIMYGGGKGLSDIVFLTVGTGIGGTLFLNGKLYGGYRNRGTELGHIIIHGSNGNRCTCGTSGCLEAHASVSALKSSYKQLLKKKGKLIAPDIDGKYIVEHYKNKEEEAVIAMEDHFANLSLGIASLINVFAPQKIIIGGGISDAGDFYIGSIRERVEKIVMKETSEYTVIEHALLGNKAGCIGAAALVFSH